MLVLKTPLVHSCDFFIRSKHCLIMRLIPEFEYFTILLLRLTPRIFKYGGKLGPWRFHTNLN